MAEPINHNFESGALTAASSAAKWGALGLLGSAVVCSALAVGALVGGAALTGGLLSLFHISTASTAAGFLWGGAGTALTVGAGVIGAIGGVAFGTVPALLGGLFGLAKGGSRVSNEKEAYREYAQTVSQTRQQKLTRQITDAEIAAEQRGYVVGAQDAEAHIANQLQTMAMQQQSALTQAEQTTGNAAGAVATATAEAKCECGPHSKAVLDQRQASAAAGVTPQV